MQPFKISPKGETENKTIRFPLELINRIEKALVGQNISFSRFVILACEYALLNMETSNDIDKQKKELRFLLYIS